uniref:Uncharacterized protein n=1 Tax=Timema cristinae TaxID=61476 RepID=A0A7R9DPW6_TIMCR|nr:unnamed protein product [Timema cristinae]
MLSNQTVCCTTSTEALRTSMRCLAVPQPASACPGLLSST